MGITATGAKLRKNRPATIVGLTPSATAILLRQFRRTSWLTDRHAGYIDVLKEMGELREFDGVD